VGNESPKFAQTFISGRKAGDGPKFAANFIQRRGHPNFEKNLSKLWPGPSDYSKGVGSGSLAVAAAGRRVYFVGVVRLSQVLGLGAVEMRAFDCMRRVRAREVVARAYGDAGIRCADRTARR